MKEEKDIEKILKNYTNQINSMKIISSEEKNKSMASLLEKEIQVKKNSDSTHNLMLLIGEQFGFITKFAGGWYLLWLGFMAYLIFGKVITDNSSESMIAISLMPMLLMLFVVDDIAKLYLKSMMEIEFATKYSFGKIMMIRMLIMTMVNLLIVIICSVVMANFMDIEVYRLLLYGISPMMIFQTAVLKCMEYFRGNQLKFISIMLYMLIAVGEFMVEEFIRDIYAVGLTSYWKLAFVAGSVMCMVQFAHTRKVISKCENVLE